MKSYIPLEQFKAQLARLPHPILEIRRNQPGAPPGTLTSPPEAAPPRIEVLAFDSEEHLEQVIESLDALPALREKWPVLWVNVVGLGDVEVVRTVGEQFGLHKLALEDVLNIPQRPKLESYDERLFLIARMPRAGGTVADGIEQVSLFLGKGWVVTFQEREGDVLEPVRQRIRASRARLARLGADYLAYTILDAIIDSYFPLLEDFGEELAEVEALILSGDTRSTVPRIYGLKRDLLAIRRAMWPQRDAVFALYREPSEIIARETQIHLRDCADHCNHIIDLIENYREIGASLVDLQLSMSSQRMNEIMKVLTIIATIFIPLTFIAGVYGMNFNPDTSPWNMPELNWRYGYPAAMSVMLLIALTMLGFFWRKGWLGNEGVRIDPGGSE
jgi:magnesium transporter